MCVTSEPAAGVGATTKAVDAPLCWLSGTQDDFVVVVGEEGDEGERFGDYAHVVAGGREQRDGVTAAGGIGGECAVRGESSDVDGDLIDPGQGRIWVFPAPGNPCTSMGRFSMRPSLSRAASRGGRGPGPMPSH